MRIASVCGLLFLLCASNTAHSQYPISHLRAIQPPVVEAGKATVMRLVGGDLTNIDRLWFSDPGIVANLKTKAAKPFAGQETAPDYGHFEVTANAAPGIYEVRADGLNGASTPLRFVVSDLPVTVISGDNSTHEKATALAVPGWVTGTVRASGFSYIALELDSKDPIVIDAFARRIDSTSDVQVDVLNESGRRLVRGRRSTTSEDPRILFEPPAPGKYYVAVSDRLFGGADSAYFAIKVHRGPMVRWVEPAAINKAGDAEVKLFGYGFSDAQGTAGPWQFVTRKIAADTISSHGALVRPEVAESGVVRTGVLGADGNAIGYSDLKILQEQEPNNTLEQAAAMEIGSEVSGVFEKGRDTDWYRFDAKKDQSYEIALLATRLGQDCDPALGIFRADTAADGKLTPVQVKMVDDHKDRDKLRTNPFARASTDPSDLFKADRDGTFYLRVSDQFRVGEQFPPVQYRLCLRAATPAIRAYSVMKQLRVDNGNQYTPASLSVRKGETIGVLVEIEKIAWDGPVSVRCDNLPEGVKCQSTVIPAGATSTLLLFSVDENASFDPIPVTIKVSGKSGEQEISADAIPLVCPNTSGDVNNVRAFCRTTSTLVLSLGGDTVHATVSVEAGAEPPKVKPEEKHVVKFQLVRRHGFNAALKFKAYGLAGNWKVADKQLDDKTASADYEIPVPKDAKPGVYAFYLRADATVKAMSNSALHQQTTEYRKHLDSVEAETKKQRAEEKDAAKQKTLDEQLKQIAAAKTAADNEIKNFAKTADRKIHVLSQPYLLEVVAK